MSQVKSPLPPPVPATIQGIVEGRVTIQHPGYNIAYPPLLRFLTFRNEGVDYDLVYYTACIIAGNVWSDDPAPYLTRERGRNSARVVRPDDGILRDNKYYFHVPKCETHKYPVTLSFSDWVFPHDDVPQIWRDLVVNQSPLETRQRLPSILREAIITRDGSCRMTQSVTALEEAHIIPLAEADWFTKNKMDQYNISPSSRLMINDVGNLFALRGDINWQFDQKHFTAIPKIVGDEYKLVGQMLQGNEVYLREQEYLFHNRPFQQLSDIPREYLFARFAWSIFNSTTLSFLPTSRRPLAVRFRLEAESEEESEEEEIEHPPVKLLVERISSMAALPNLRQGLPADSGHKRTRDEPAQEGQHNDDVDLFWSIEEGKLVHVNQIDYPFGEPGYDRPIMCDSESEAC